jgi:Arc/MetJ-type ribon-helix-helix transcriptional regulator
MSTQVINLSLPKELVQRIDQAAKGEYASRSEYIRQAVVSRLKGQDSDLWAALLAGADEVQNSARLAGYTSGEDYARAVREVRSEAKKQ